MASNYKNTDSNSLLDETTSTENHFLIMSKLQNMNVSAQNPTGFSNDQIISTLTSIANNQTLERLVDQERLLFNPSPKFGLSELIKHCGNIYRNNNPIKLFQTGKQYVFDGGEEPLDLIQVYKNDNILTHWHYVSFGLSDIHNYQETLELYKSIRDKNQCDQYNLQEHFHEPNDQENQDDTRLSGFGIELTFRLKCDPSLKQGQQPPKWPVQIMQSIARFIFKTKCVPREGEYFIWNQGIISDSQIKHFLVTTDSELKQVYVSSMSKGMCHDAKVEFVQLVGVTEDELDAAKKYDSKAILNIMSKQQTGHRLLITDMDRKESIIDFERIDSLNSEIKKTSSNLINMVARHSYTSRRPKSFLKEDQISSESSIFESSSSSCESKLNEVDSNYNDDEEEEDQGSLKEVYLSIGLDIAGQLSSMIEYRLNQGKAFIISDPNEDLSTTLVPGDSSFEDEEFKLNTENPFFRKDNVLYIFLDNGLREALSNVLDPAEISKINSEDLPKIYSWPEKSFHLIISEQGRLNYNK